MPGYQFITIETYARVPSKNAKKQSIFGIAKEAERVPEASLHVESPQKPYLMYGDMPGVVVDKAVKLAEKCKDPRERKIRKDGQVLLSGVASYPPRSNEVDLKSDDFQNWLKLNIEFLKKEYDNNLKSIILHTDEEYLHIHFYVLPEPSKENHLHIRSVHCGMSARDTVHEKAKGSGKLRSRLYKAAMRDFQERYYQQVGKVCGFTKSGPGRRRLSRKEWKAEQEQAEKQAEAIKTINAAKAKEDHIAKRTKEAKAIISIAKTEKAEATKYVHQKAEIESASLFSNKSKIIDFLRSEVAKLRKKMSFWKTKAETEEANYLKEKSKNSELATKAKEAQISANRAERENSQLHNTIELQKKGMVEWRRKYSEVVLLAKAGQFKEILKKQEITHDVQ